MDLDRSPKENGTFVVVSELTNLRRGIGGIGVFSHHHIWVDWSKNLQDYPYWCDPVCPSTLPCLVPCFYLPNSFQIVSPQRVT